MIEVYPAVKVFCPKTQMEEDGSLCYVCMHFRGIAYNDFDTRDKNQARVYIRCFYEEVGEDENE